MTQQSRTRQAISEIVSSRIAYLQTEITSLRALNAELVRLCEKALTRSAIVHPGFADELRAAIAKATQ